MITQSCNDIIIDPIIVSTEQSGQRLDRVLSLSLSSIYSRSKIKNWILAKKVRINNQVITIPKKKMQGGEKIEIIGVIDHKINDMCPQDIPLNIVYEDNDIIVINKASNMVVHPGAGNYLGTILNALLYKFPSIIAVPRAGIIHRLDKDTTGLMVAAKNIVSYNNLLQSFKNHQIRREYEAVVFGKFKYNIGTINQPIRRHNIHRTCMAVDPMGKMAVTHYYVLETFARRYTRIRIQLGTGRTHQIRVHMAYINHPLVGDQKYGKLNCCIKQRFSDELRAYLHILNRQALHACSLKLLHPITRIQMEWNIPLPQDMSHLINVMRTIQDCVK